MHIRAFGLQVLLWNGKKLGTSGQNWLADSRFFVLVILWISSFVSGDTAIAMEIPKAF